MLAPVTHILPLTTIVRARLLPIPGEVSVRAGQKVNAGDIVAEAAIPRGHYVVDVARELGVTPEQADKAIKSKKGDAIAKDAIIAETSGLVGREVESPVQGRVIAVGGGKVLIQTGQSTINVKAGLPGVVSSIMNNRGAVISGTGVLVQGVWGNGRIETGVMLSLCEKPTDMFQSDQLDVSMRGSVILAGYLGQEKALTVAGELPLRGLIVSSIAPELVPVAAKMEFPIIALEGIGKFPMNSAAHRLLTTNVKRDVAINAELFDRLAGTRPEIVIPLPISQEPPVSDDVIQLAVGQTVRLRRAPHLGQVGTLIAIRPGLSQLPNGLRVPAADVKVESGDTIIVPLVNLEVLG